MDKRNKKAVRLSDYHSLLLRNKCRNKIQVRSYQSSLAEITQASKQKKISSEFTFDYTSRSTNNTLKDPGYS